MIHQNVNQLDLYADFQRCSEDDEDLVGGYAVCADDVSGVVLELVWERVSQL